MPLAAPTGCNLHIPFKNWSDDPHEESNYNEIERWSLRLVTNCLGARGEVGFTDTTTTLNVTATPAAYVALPSFPFLGGRRYRVHAEWPGISGTVAGDVVQMNVFIGPSNIMCSFFTIAVPGTAPSTLSFGGSVDARFVPAADVRTQVGLSAARSGTGNVAVYGSTIPFAGYLAIYDEGSAR